MTLHRLYDQEHVATQYVPYVTGPGALKAAIIHFMGANDLEAKNKMRKAKGLKPLHHWQRVSEGRYTGLYNRTMTIKKGVPTKRFVRRSVVPGKNLLALHENEHDSFGKFFILLPMHGLECRGGNDSFATSVLIRNEY